MILQQQNGMAFWAGRWPLDADRPTLIFIHGSGQEGRFWKHQMEGLTAVANTIAPDLPGHGHSAGGGLRQVGAYSRAINDFIRACRIPGPIPCGLSLGGAITLDMLIRDSDHTARNLKAGILVNTGARLKVLPAIIDTIERDYDDFLQMLVAYGLAEANRAAVTPELLACSRAAAAVTADDFRACDVFDVMKDAARIDRPVLILSAVHDRLTPLKYAQWMENNIKGSRHVSIAAAGHFSPLEQPAAVNTAIHDFLITLKGAGNGAPKG